MHADEHESHAEIAMNGFQSILALISRRRIFGGSLKGTLSKHTSSCVEDVYLMGYASVRFRPKYQLGCPKNQLFSIMREKKCNNSSASTLTARAVRPLAIG